MKLYLVHCGFYDGEVFDGVYESHVNFFVAAESFEDARAKAKLNPIFKHKKMHVDGLQQIEMVDGYHIALEEDTSSSGQSKILSNKHRDLAPNKTSPRPLSLDGRGQGDGADTTSSPHLHPLPQGERR